MTILVDDEGVPRIAQKVSLFYTNWTVEITLFNNSILAVPAELVIPNVNPLSFTDYRSVQYQDLLEHAELFMLDVVASGGFPNVDYSRELSLPPKAAVDAILSFCS